MRLDLQGLLDKARSASVRVPDRDIKDISGLRAGHGWSIFHNIEDEMLEKWLKPARILSSKADPDATPPVGSRGKKARRRARRARRGPPKKSHLAPGKKSRKLKRKHTKKKKSKKSKKSRKSRRRKHTKRRR